MKLVRLLAPLLAATLSLSSAACSSATAEEDDAGGTADAVTAVDRQAVMDALRAKVKPELKNQDIQFDVSKGHFKGAGAFVFLSGKIVRKGSGAPVDYKDTEYQAAIDEGFFDDHIDALLEKRAGKWSVVVRAIGSTDVAWTTWAEDHGAPREIFPGGGGSIREPAGTAAAHRKAIMDSLRAKVKPVLKNQDIVFDVSKGGYTSDGEWTFLLGKVALRNSKFKVDYRGTAYQEAIDDGVFDDHIAALFHHDGSKWSVVAYEIGSSDAAFTTWPAQYGAPAAILR